MFFSAVELETKKFFVKYTLKLSRLSCCIVELKSVIRNFDIDLSEARAREKRCDNNALITNEFNVKKATH